MASTAWGAGGRGVGHELHMHGEHPTVGLHVAKREPGAPRLAIVTLGHLTPQKRSAPSNVKAYANHWKYDLVDASKTVSTAAKALRAGKGDHSFLRGRWVGGWVGGLLFALHATRNLPYTLILRPYCCVSPFFQVFAFYGSCRSTLGLLARADCSSSTSAARWTRTSTTSTIWCSLQLPTGVAAAAVARGRRC